MKGIITEFNLTGNSVIDVDFVCKKWTDKFYIAAWINEDEEKYTLVINGKRKGSRLLKTQISKEQTQELSKRLNLIQVKDGTFKSASIFITKKFARMEHERLLTIEREKQKEVNLLQYTIIQYQNAIVGN